MSDQAPTCVLEFLQCYPTYSESAFAFDRFTHFAIKHTQPSGHFQQTSISIIRIFQKMGVSLKENDV